VNRSSSRARRPPIASLRERQREAVTAAVLDAAEAVIADKGLADAGMAEIAKRAGVAVGTLYNYFTDRDGLVRALVDTRRAALGPKIRELAERTTGNFETRLRRFFHDVLTMFEEHRRFIRIAYETEPILQAHGPRNRAIIDTLRNALRDLLIAGVVEGKVDEATLALQVRLLGSALKTLILHELEMGGPFAREADAVIDLFLHGARAR
jgi:AcrR family transcriptional regulator